MKKLFTLLSFSLFLFTNYISADECSPEERQLVNQISLGPEVYHVKREKAGGSYQSGTLSGVRLGYDRIKRYGWYIGGEFLYATGDLNGKSGAGDKISSKLTDSSIEGRFGYTFQQKGGYNAAITPFIGIGYFEEKNNFKHPSPIPVHFKNNFTYIPVGFLSHLYLDFIDCKLGAGINFYARYITSHQVKTTNDPTCDYSKLHYKEEIQYRVELPITYDFYFYERLWQVRLEPFFEYRHYGELANYPFDFLDTKFKIYGANLQLIYLF